MADTKVDKGTLTASLIPDRPHPNPDAGIICPFNQDEHGPAGIRIHCGVFHNLDDYNEFGSEGHFRFCEQLCQRGRNPEQANRRRQIRDRYFAIPAWLRPLPEAVPSYMKSVIGRRL